MAMLHYNVFNQVQIDSLIDLVSYEEGNGIKITKQIYLLVC